MVPGAPEAGLVPGPAGGAVPWNARKRFFLEKEAKTFAHWGARWIQRAPQVAKVFWFFFSKKNCLLLVPGADRRQRLGVDAQSCAIITFPAVAGEVDDIRLADFAGVNHFGRDERNARYDVEFWTRCIQLCKGQATDVNERE